MSSSATVEEVEVVTTRPAPETTAKHKQQPNYVVVVENDDRHTFIYVIEVLQKVCGIAWKKRNDWRTKFTTPVARPSGRGRLKSPN